MDTTISNYLNIFFRLDLPLASLSFCSISNVRLNTAPNGTKHHLHFHLREGVLEHRQC
jgi:hypothetical protein